MGMPGRKFYQNNSYRYGFNGQEHSLELHKESYTAEYWQYDSRIGRRWNVDPAIKVYESPYSAFGNNPIYLIDISGADTTVYNPGGGTLDLPTSAVAGRLSTNGNVSGTTVQAQHTNGAYESFAIGDKEFTARYDVNTGNFLHYKSGTEIYDYENYRTKDNDGPWTVGWQWLTGSSTRSHNFVKGDPFTEKLREHGHVIKTMNNITDRLYKSDGMESISGSNPYNLGGIQGVPKYISDYSTLLTGGLTGNIAVTYLGSYSLRYKVTCVDIERKTAIVQFSVSNTSTIESATHPPVVGYTKFWSNNIGKPLNNFFSSGPLSKKTQYFQWSELLNFGEPKKAESTTDYRLIGPQHFWE